jgi:very-short-patch-repair endonuclease
MDVVRAVRGVTIGQVRAAGITDGHLKRLCRERRWLRLHRGVYFVDGQWEEPPRAAIIRAALLSAGPHAVAVLGTAAEVLGIAGIPATDEVHLSLPGPKARPRRYADEGVHLHQLVLRHDQLMTVNGMRVTMPARTVADLMTRTPRLVAVAVLDSSLHRRLLVEDDLDLVRGLVTGHRGAASALRWIREADGRAESPLETRVRLRASDANLAPDELQYRVTNAIGDVVAIGDLAWIRAHGTVIGEADGVEAHDNPVAVFRDRHRQNALLAAGFTVVRFTWRDTLDPATIPRTLRAAFRPAA